MIDEAQLPTIEQWRTGLTQSLRGVFGELNSTAIDFLRHAAAAAPAKAAFLEPDRAGITYAELLAQAGRIVAALNAHGLTPRSHIGLALPTTATAAAVYVCVGTGMPILPLNPAAAADDTASLLRQAEAAAVLALPSSAPGVREAAARLGIPVIDLLVDDGGSVGSFSIAADAIAAPQFAGPDDLAELLPTSGTTALPKLIPRTQRELALATYLLVAGFKDLTSAIVNMAPYYHGSGLITILWSIASHVGMASLAIPAPDQIYRYLALYKPAAFFAVPSLLQLLVAVAPQHQAEIEQAQMRSIVVSSAALPEQLYEQVQAMFKVPVILVYGATEVTAISSTMQSPANPAYRPGSVGQPGAVARVRITDEDGTVLPPGAHGEIEVRTASMVSGYWKNPEADALSFRDGWFRSGDAGYMDADGYIYLTGRIKEVINRGGSKISPLEIDAVLEQHPAVSEAASFGFPHSALGEDIAAAVVLRDPAVSERDLRLFAAERLPMTKVPSRFVFVEALPKTALGKIRRTVLAEHFNEELAR